MVDSPQASTPSHTFQSNGETETSSSQNLQPRLPKTAYQSRSSLRLKDSKTHQSNPVTLNLIAWSSILIVHQVSSSLQPLYWLFIHQTRLINVIKHSFIWLVRHLFIQKSIKLWLIKSLSSLSGHLIQYWWQSIGSYS
jgi:hypothetical protein